MVDPPEGQEEPMEVDPSPAWLTWHMVPGLPSMTHHYHDHGSGVTGVPSQCLTIGPTSASGISWEAQPPHLAILWALLAMSNYFVDCSGWCESFSPIPDSTPPEGVPSLCSEPQEKGMRLPGFHRAAAPNDKSHPSEGHQGPWGLEVGFLQSEDEKAARWVAEDEARPPLWWCMKNSNR
ncbi:hypothetical protein llap_1709 [Limosa lapponica baueri]|uniref:Uncharacterized protein n=1 Tax=Limosa lapponica baueri TaxID=1758121 RepID=A0A2I0UPM3_LIMLA|nr:hypothetical protein llap_1709 [Limosa lapponica baueri]